MMGWRHVVRAAAAVAAFGTAAAAQVAAGSVLTFQGAADALDLGTPGVQLDFVGPVAIGTAGNTGSFAGLNRPSGAAVTATVSDLLVGQGPQPIANLLTVGGYRFSLTVLPRGPFGQAECYVAPAAGQTCTPYQGELGNPRPGIDLLSPFYMANLPGDATTPLYAAVAFNLVGTVAGPRGPASAFFGTIYTVLPGSYQQVLGGLEFAGGFGAPLPGVPFSGRFVVGGRSGASGMAEIVDIGFDPTVAPEPATVALVAGGLVLVAGAARRRRSA